MPRNELAMPFIKWVGGKRQLLRDIERLLPPRSRTYTYFEPFLGGGAVLFYLQPKRAVVNDSNRELVNCYETVRDQPEELIEDLQHHQNTRDYYYSIRDLDREPNFAKHSRVRRASRIIYLNKTCYNGLFRVNAQGQFNVPYGKYKNPNIVNAAIIRAVSRYLNSAKVSILNTDFAEAVRPAKRGDFVYFDPPYDPVTSTASFTGYDVNGFDRDEQKRLKTTFDDLSSRGCYVMLSNSNTSFIRSLYKDYRIITVTANRAVNSVASKRGDVEEVIVVNYNAKNKE